jgi:hypothetical protein
VSATEQRLAERPAPIGLAASFGFGDRLGLATPGHVAALRETGVALVPVFAQQSVRELARTGRTFEAVLRSAIDGARAARWTEPFGADADHLKELGEVQAAAAAGYTMFTLDPSDHVDASERDLESRFRSLPWADLGDTPRTLADRHRVLELDRVRLEHGELELARAAVKYLRAVAHAARLAEAVPAGSDIEVSVDETSSPTTVFEHAFVALELKRRGVELTSLAPRFPGSFEKGIEYVGSLDAFAAALRGHVEVAEALGPYKLSLHSGSDKVSLYHTFAEVTRGRFHVKTAGTSYLEALRTVSETEPDLLVEIWAQACERYAEDRRSYTMTAEISDVLPRQRPTELLDDQSARRILHVTYGSILSDEALAGRLRAALQVDGCAAYTRALERHLGAHLRALRS